MRIQIYGDERESSLNESVRTLVDEAVTQMGVADVDIEFIAVHNDDEAKSVRSLGAPTIRIDGFDVEYAEREPPETTAGARYYSLPEGWKRVPERGMVVFAMKEAQARAARKAAAPQQ
jgi:hypothetical protein